MIKDANYTVFQDERINNHIKNDLEIIKKEIFKEFDGVECILLGGGFGREEGSVVVYKSKIQPLNDYDIYIVSENKLNHEKIQLIRSRLSSLIKIRQIDIDIKTKKDLQQSKKSIADYDLKYASKLIYGNSDILNFMPDFKPNEINLTESLIPINLYLISIIQSYPFEFNYENIFWGKQQISKSILGWSMAMLVSEGVYHESYVKRQKIFKELTNDNERIDLVNFATNFKIKPTLDSEIDWEVLWNKNLKIHLSVLYEIYSKYYKKKINNIFDVIDCIKNNYINRLKKIIGFISGKNFYLKRENLFIIELLILSYINESNKEFSSSLIQIENELKKRLSINKIDIKKILKYCIDNDINCAIWKKRGNKIFY